MHYRFAFLLKSHIVIYEQMQFLPVSIRRQIDLPPILSYIVVLEYHIGISSLPFLTANAGTLLPFSQEFS